jgi:hypothetical protein
MGLGPEGIPRKLDIIREHCEAVGRDYAEIEKTVLARVTLSRAGSGTTTQRAPVQTVDQAVERFGRLSDAGVDTILLGMGNDTDDEAYELVAEVVRQVEPLTAPDRQASR